MGLGKWIGGIVGFMSMGPLGALAGYALGSLFDNATSKQDNQQDINNDQQTYDNAYSGQRNSFLFSLLVLASYIIRADGKIMHSEMEYVRRFLRNNFGEQSVREGEQILLNLFEQRKQIDAQNPYAFKNTIRECCEQIHTNLNYGECLQLLNFLVEIAYSDGTLSPEEIDALKEICLALHIPEKELNSMLHLTNDSLDDAYAVLQISPTATDAEVKAAYRQLALQHHPDRVATLGEDIRKAAVEKLKLINDAKDRIYKARGIK